MKRKSFPAGRIAPLQKVVAEPITDLAEQAALDEMRKQHEGRALKARFPQLTPEDRLTVLTRLAADLSLDEQLELLAELLARVSPQVIRVVEEG